MLAAWTSQEPRAKVTSPVTPGVRRPACASLRRAPTPLKHPRLVMVSESALHLLGLNPAEAERRAEAYAECESATSSGRPWLAACSMGHGQWVLRLSDFRLGHARS